LSKLACFKLTFFEPQLVLSSNQFCSTSGRDERETESKEIRQGSRRDRECAYRQGRQSGAGSLSGPSREVVLAGGQSQSTGAGRARGGGGCRRCGDERGGGGQGRGAERSGESGGRHVFGDISIHAQRPHFGRDQPSYDRWVHLFASPDYRSYLPHEHP
jgi:hypothetical protein